MSVDKSHGSVRRPRLIARPQLPEGPLKHLKDLLYQLYLDAGAPSLDEITSWIALDDALDGAPERDTIRRCLGAPELPANQHDVVAVAAVLARAARWDPAEATDRIRALWVNAHMIIPLGQPLRGLTDPIALKVHPVIDVPNAPLGLPVYLPRRHDDMLSTVLATACDRPVMAVIVGESSTGKTRAAFEAVHRVLPDWNFYYPLAPSKPKALAEALNSDRLAPRTILWLDELREYLMPPGGEDAAAYLHEFLRHAGAFAVIATIWPDDWSELTTVSTPTTPAPFPRACGLLRSAAHRIDIDASFDQPQLMEAIKRDPRLRQAYNSTEKYGQITQYLAAGYALIEWYSSISTTYPGAWAVVTASMDAHRLGHPDPVPEEFLAAAAPRYLTRETWGTLQDSWLQESLAASTRTLRGAARPLTRIRPYPDEDPQPIRYQLADYLAQYGRIQRHLNCPPESFWRAADDRLGDPAAQIRLGFSAEARGRLRHGTLLQKHAAQMTDPAALRYCARILWRYGNRARAEEYLRRAAELGEAQALSDLAAYLGSSKSEDQIIELYEQAASLGERDALRRLARHLWENGNQNKAEEFYARAVEKGDKWARWWWASDLEAIGEHDRVVELCKEDAAKAPPDLSLWWVPSLFRAGQAELAEELLRKVVSHGNTEALWRWAEELWKDDRGRAEGLFKKAIDEGNEHALRRWAGMLEKSGDINRAKELLLQAAVAGDNHSLWWLANMLWDNGLQNEAEEYYIRAADAGCWFDVPREWAKRLRKREAVEKADRLIRFGLTCDGEISKPWTLTGLDTMVII